MEPWQVARRLLGVPFAHMGRSERGVDCVGLLVWTASECGLEVDDSPHYGRMPAAENDAFGLRDYLRANCGEPVDREPRPNDIVLLRLGRFPNHAGIIAPHPEGIALIHTHHRAGKVVMHRVDERWKKRIVEVYAWPAHKA